MSRLVLNIYSALMRLAQPLLRRKLARRAVAEPGYGMAVNERFGHYTQAAEPSPELVWLHAVSLGETRAAAVLLAVSQRFGDQVIGAREGLVVQFQLAMPAGGIL